MSAVQTVFYKVMNISPSTYYTVLIGAGGILFITVLLMVITMMESMAMLFSEQVETIIKCVRSQADLIELTRLPKAVPQLLF